MYVLSKFEFRIARASEVFNQLISFIDNLGLSCKFYSKKNVHLLQLSLTTLLLILETIYVHDSIRIEIT